MQEFDRVWTSCFIRCSITNVLWIAVSTISRGTSWLCQNVSRQYIDDNNGEKRQVMFRPDEAHKITIFFYKTIHWFRRVFCYTLPNRDDDSWCANQTFARQTIPGNEKQIIRIRVIERSSEVTICVFFIISYLFFQKTNTSLRSSINFSTVRRLKLGSALVFVTKVDSLTVDIFNQTYDVWEWCTNAPLKRKIRGGGVGSPINSNRKYDL